MIAFFETVMFVCLAIWLWIIYSAVRRP